MKKITKIPMKIAAIGKSWEKASLAKAVSYEVIPCMIVQPCPPNAPSAKCHMRQYYCAHPHNRNSTQQDFPDLLTGSQSRLIINAEETNAPDKNISI